MTLSQGEEQRAGWAELFFDLVFVVAVARLAHLLEGDPGPAQFGTFVLLFVAPWWVWLTVTVFVNVTGSDSTRSRLALLASMAAMGVMAVAIPEATGERATVYALGFIASRVVSFAMWWAVAPLKVVLAFNGFSSALWAISIFVPPPYRALLWLAGVACEVVTLIVIQPRKHEPSYQVPHIVERVGLFVIIVLGESVAAALGALDQHWSAAGWVVLGLGFVLFAALWWSYFDFTSAVAARELLPAKNSRVRDVMGIGHFPVVAALTSMAAGLGTAVAEPGHLPYGAALALCGGLALYRLTFLVLALLLGQPAGPVAGWTALGLVVAVGTLALFPVIPAWAVVGLLAAEVVTRLTRTLTVRRATAEVTSPAERPQQEVAR
ncbi:low temperature requirement protein A [Streptosporangium sp. NPDC000396]|uniref:low temperature requirement protein A n=1 Tax=Streptosporangium sp. NPDC000396 TaxID=3366185 RepID=UPI0036C95AA1